MKDTNIYKKLYASMSNLINSIDPASLGGADGEYDNQINELIKLIMMKKYSLTKKDIKLVFDNSYIGISSLSPKEIDLIESEIGKLIKNIF